MATIPSMPPTLKHISVKYHYLRQHVGKEFVSENKKADISTKGLQGKIFQDLEVAVWLVSLHMRGSGSRNSIFSLKLR